MSGFSWDPYWGNEPENNLVSETRYVEIIRMEN